MIRAILIFLALNTASVYLVSRILDDFELTGGTLAYVFVGVIIGLLNVFVKPILKVLSLPFIFVTLGLFVILINALILWLTETIVAVASIPGLTFVVTGAGTYIAAVILLGLVNYIFQKII